MEVGPLPPSGWILGLWGEPGPGEGQEVPVCSGKLLRENWPIP